MRVLLITDWLAGVGGAERYMLGVRQGLLAAGDEVRLLTSDVGTAADGTAEYRARGSERVAAKAVLQIANPFAARAVHRALREFHPDVALVNMFEHQLSAAIFGPLRAIPTVLSVTDYKGICPVSSKLLPDGSLCHVRAGLACWQSGCLSGMHWLRDQPRYSLIRWGRTQARRVVTCSRWMREELARQGIEAEHLALPVSPPGTGFRRRVSEHPTMVFCGRLDRTKGVPLLLRAFARLRQSTAAACLRIVGDGPERPGLEALARSLGLGESVTFRGRVPFEQVDGEYADAWAVVVPSLWAEPLGLVALEAIVRGIPVIASAAGGLGESVRHGVSGLLFANGNEDELVSQLEAVATRRAFADHTVADDAVQVIARTHSHEAHTDRLRGIFRSLSVAPVPTMRAPQPVPPA